MTDKEVRKLKRADLLEMLIIQSKRIEQLEQELKQTKEKLEDKEIKIKDAGSIAMAALELNGIFESAQKAADQYLENIRLSAEKDFTDVNRDINNEEE